MDYHRAKQIKGSESTKYQRLPSPMTYIQNYNKVCSEENEQTKQCMPIDRKHNTLFLWNDGYVELNRIKIPNVMEERKQKRKIFQQNTMSHPTMMTATNQNLNNINTIPTHYSTYQKDNIKNQNNSDSEDDHPEHYRSQRQKREKVQEQQMQHRTEQLEKMMKENNANQVKIKKTRDDVMLIDNNQRKYFSHTKQQMLELQNHILGSQKISKEIMDRKGLSLRKVLSSIPQDKLMQIIDYKQYHFSKIMNEKILPKQQFRLKSMISPKFTGEHNYDFNRTSTSKFFNQTSNSFMPNNASNLKTPSNKPMSQQQNVRTRTLQSRGKLETQQSAKDIQDSQFILKKSSGILEKKGSQQNLTKQGSKLSQGNILQSQKKSQQDFNNYNNLIDNYYDDNLDDNEQMRLEEMPIDKKKELRIKSTNEVTSTIQKLNEIQEESIRQQKNSNIGIRIPQELLGQVTSMTYKPKSSLDKMLQHEDEMERQIFIQSLENVQKDNEKKNFFNYSNYFYGKYSKQNNGLSTKLSQNALKENEIFQQNLLHLIQEVDQDHSVKLSY